jgi:phage terminase large subunit-like protein
MARAQKTPPPNTSTADPVTSYAREVGLGRIAAGPHVRAACKRHLRDLEEAEAKGFHWDLGAALDAIEFFPAVLRLNGGEFEGVPFALLDWQAFIIGSLFGWKKSDGYRRFRQAYVETGKGSGKSPLAAGVGLYGMIADGEDRAEIYAAARKKDQAMILFRDAVAMVDLSPALGAMIKKSGRGQNVWNLAYLAKGSFFRPIAADEGISGPRPHIGLLDEIHEHRTNETVEMIRAGTKGRRQALIFMITNSGADRTGVCFEYHMHGRKVAAGDIEDDSFFAYICALDEGDDPFKSEDCWAKANPSLGKTFQLSYLREQVSQARGMPSKEAIVRRLNFCEWTDAASPPFDRDLWEARLGEVDPEDLIGHPCWLSLDMADKRDLNALTATWDVDGTLHCKTFFWTPGDTIDERGRQDQVPYRAWADRGFMFATAGRMVDKKHIALFVQKFCVEHDVHSLVFDPAMVEQFLKAADEIGLDVWLYDGPKSSGYGLKMVRHRQGHWGMDSESQMWMPKSIRELEERIVNGGIVIDENPCLNWNMASAVLEADPSGNRKWDKRKATGRIDGMISLTMGVGAASASPTAPADVFAMIG